MLISESINQLIQENAPIPFTHMSDSKFKVDELNIYIRFVRGVKEYSNAIKILLDHGKTCKNYVPIIWFTNEKPSKSLQTLIKSKNIYIIIEPDNDDQQYNDIIKDAKAKYKLS
jgi:hypothetical protein